MNRAMKVFAAAFAPLAEAAISEAGAHQGRISAERSSSSFSTVTDGYQLTIVVRIFQEPNDGTGYGYGALNAATLNGAAIASGWDTLFNKAYNDGGDGLWDHMGLGANAVSLTRLTELSEIPNSGQATTAGTTQTLPGMAPLMATFTSPVTVADAATVDRVQGCLNPGMTVSAYLGLKSTCTYELVQEALTGDAQNTLGNTNFKAGQIMSITFSPIKEVPYTGATACSPFVFQPVVTWPTQQIYSTDYRAYTTPVGIANAFNGGSVAKHFDTTGGTSADALASGVVLGQLESATDTQQSLATRFAQTQVANAAACQLATSDQTATAADGSNQKGGPGPCRALPFVLPTCSAGCDTTSATSSNYSTTYYACTGYDYNNIRFANELLVRSFSNGEAATTATPGVGGFLASQIIAASKQVPEGNAAAAFTGLTDPRANMAAATTSNSAVMTLNNTATSCYTGKISLGAIGTEVAFIGTTAQRAAGGVFPVGIKNYLQSQMISYTAAGCANMTFDVSCESGCENSGATAQTSVYSWNICPTGCQAAVFNTFRTKLMSSMTQYGTIAEDLVTAIKAEGTAQGAGTAITDTDLSASFSTNGASPFSGYPRVGNFIDFFMYPNSNSSDIPVISGSTEYILITNVLQQQIVDIVTQGEWYVYDGTCSVLLGNLQTLSGVANGGCLASTKSFVIEGVTVPAGVALVFYSNADANPVQSIGVKPPPTSIIQSSIVCGGSPSPFVCPSRSRGAGHVGASGPVTVNSALLSALHNQIAIVNGTMQQGGAQTSCFSGDTVVATEHGSVPMSKLSVGDLVQTAAGLQPVLSFIHHGVDSSMKFVQINHDQGLIEMSDNHMLHLVDGRDVPAHDIQVGDRLVGVDGTASLVKEIGTVQKSSWMAPLTESGTIMAGGATASAYVQENGTSHWVAHFGFAPVRFLASAFSFMERAADFPHTLVKPLVMS